MEKWQSDAKGLKIQALLLKAAKCREEGDMETVRLYHVEVDELLTPLSARRSQIGCKGATWGR
jgi:hypothetical protein